MTSLKATRTRLSSPHHVPSLIRELLSSLGENPKRAGLEKTPERVAQFFEYITHGYDLNLKKIINGAVFREKYDEMVLVRDIEFFSLCEHHLLPFFGKAHVAYIPHGKVVGLSKIPRIVDMFSHRLQLQERLTEQIADALAGSIHPRGVGVVVEAEHFCIRMRGVKKNSTVVTSALRGLFKENRKTREEFLSLVFGRVG